MHAELLEQLRQHYDLHPIGFPRTQGGAERRILERLFEEEEARIALHLSPAPETPESLAGKTGQDPEKLTRLLDRMAEKGLILRSRTRKSYRMIPFMPGIYEFQLKTMDKELARDFEEFYPELARELFSSPTPFPRVVPVEKHLPVDVEVYPFERASEVVKAAGGIALAECLCRKEKKLTGGGCDRPQDDICIIFSPMAEQYVDMDLARAVSVEEAMKAVDRAERAGLVRCTLNVHSHPTFMCQCCSCCCGLLRGMTELDIPTTVAKSNFQPAVELESCNGCAACVDICPVDALSLSDDKAVVNLSRCLGCGLCISECPLESLSLKRKAELTLPPASFAELMAIIAREKGKTHFYR